MAEVIIKKWKRGQIFKTYKYYVTNEEQYLQILLGRDKSRGYYRHIDVMNTCRDINPNNDARDCINSRNGIQLCDCKDNYKSYRVNYPINPPRKTKRTKSRSGLSAPITIPDKGYRNWTLVEEDVESGKETYKRFQSHEDALYAFSHRYQGLENAGYLRKNLKLNGTAKWEGDYISNSGRTETIKLKIV